MSRAWRRRQIERARVHYRFSRAITGSKLLRMIIMNRSGHNYRAAWKDYRAIVSALTPHRVDRMVNIDA